MPPNRAQQAANDYSMRYAEKRHASTDVLRSRFHRYVTNSKYGS
jgi:hypothetical protein